MKYTQVCTMAAQGLSIKVSKVLSGLCTAQPEKEMPPVWLVVGWTAKKENKVFS